MRVAPMLTAACVMFAVACAAGGGQPGPSASEDPTTVSRSEAANPGERTITGTFGGDAQLEGGCAWIDQDGKRWNVQYPEGYRVTFDPLRLSGPNGFSASKGDTLTVTGTELRDVMTTCQVGPVFGATSVTLGA